MTLLVRPAVPADVDAITATKRRAATRAYAPLHGMPAVTTWLQRRATPAFTHTRVTATGPTCRLLVAERDGALVGAGLIRREGDGAYLGDLYCDPPGTGAGTALIRQLLSVADAAAWGDVRCFVISGNRAADFFSAHGFAERTRQDNAELPGQLIEMVRPAPR